MRLFFSYYGQAANNSLAQSIHSSREAATRMPDGTENPTPPSTSPESPGKFITPHDAIFLHDGDILVAEWLPIGRLTLLRRT